MRDKPTPYYLAHAIVLLERTKRDNGEWLEYAWVTRGAYEYGLGSMPVELAKGLHSEGALVIVDPWDLWR